MKKTQSKTHEEWYVEVLQRFHAEKGEVKYLNAKQWYPGYKLGDRYCKSEAEARRVLDHAYAVHNQSHSYNSKGERYEANDAGGGIGVTMVVTPEIDRDLQIVSHRIRKRIVTEWEVVEQK